jgi:hypothetical protein
MCSSTPGVALKGLNAILEVAFYASNFLFSFFVPKKELQTTQ